MKAPRPALDGPFADHLPCDANEQQRLLRQIVAATAASPEALHHFIEGAAFGCECPARAVGGRELGERNLRGRFDGPRCRHRNRAARGGQLVTRKPAPRGGRLEPERGELEATFAGVNELENRPFFDDGDHAASRTRRLRLGAHRAGLPQLEKARPIFGLPPFETDIGGQHGRRV